MELESALKTFMKLLQNDIQQFLGVNTLFMVKLDIKLGVQKKDESKMKEYEPRLIELLNSVQTEVKPLYKIPEVLQ